MGHDVGLWSVDGWWVSVGMVGGDHGGSEVDGCDGKLVEFKMHMHSSLVEQSDPKTGLLFLSK